MDLATLGLRLDAGQLEGGAQRARKALRGVTTEATATERTLAKVKAQMAAMFGVVVIIHQVVRALKESAKAATEFEYEMTKIITLVGVAEERVAGWSAELRKLSVEVGRGPRELARAMFVITSAGERGARAMEILTQSAKASVVGLGDTATIARAVTAAMQAYSKQGLSAAEATDIMVSTVREGNLEADALAGSLGRVLGIAANAGVSFAQLGGFVATFTRVGVSAEEAVTSLRGVLNTLASPTAEADAALKEYDLTAQDLRKSIREKGLATTLIDLVELTRDNDTAIQTIIPNVRALAGVLATAGAQARQYAEINENQARAMGITDEGFKRATEDAKFAFEQMRAVMENAGITIGRVLVPPLKLLAVSMQEIVNVLGFLVKVLVPATAALLAYKVGVYAASLATIALGRSASVTTVLLQTLRTTALAVATTAGPFIALAGALALTYMWTKRNKLEMENYLAEAQLANEVSAQMQAINYRRQKAAEFRGEGMSEQDAQRAAIAWIRKKGLYGDMYAAAAESDEAKQQREMRTADYKRAAVELDALIKKQEQLNTLEVGNVEARERLTRQIELEKQIAQDRVDFSVVEARALEEKRRALYELTEEEIRARQEREGSLAVAEAENAMAMEFLRQQWQRDREVARPKLILRDMQEQLDIQNQQNAAAKRGEEALRKFNALQAVTLKYRQLIAEYPLMDKETMDAILLATYQLAYNMNLPAETFAETMKTAIKDTQRAFASFFTSILTEGVASFKQLATALSNTIMEAVSNRLAQSLTDSIAKAFTKLGAGGAVIGIGAGLFAGLLGSLGGTSKAAQEAYDALERFNESLKSMSESLSTGVAAPMYDALRKIGEEYEKAREDLELWYETMRQFNRPEITQRYMDRLAELQRVTQELTQRAIEDWLRTVREWQEDYEVRRLRAIGLESEADAMEFALEQQREYAEAVRAGADAVTLAALAEAQRVEAIRREVTLAEEQVAAAQEARDKTKALVDSLREFSRSLTLGSPFQTLGTARSEFERVAGLARGGDAAAAARLPELARTLLDLSRGYYASGSGYAREVASVQAVLDSVAVQYEEQLGYEQQALDIAIEQRDALQAILDALRQPYEITPWEDWAYTQRETNDTLAAGFTELSTKIDTLTAAVESGTATTKRTLETIAL